MVRYYYPTAHGYSDCISVWNNYCRLMNAFIPHAFTEIISESLCFTFNEGRITRMEYPYSTGWRTLNSLMTAHILEGDHRVSFDAGSIYPVRPGETICIAPERSHCSDKISHVPSISRWSHTSFTIFDTINLFDLIDLPTVIMGDAAWEIGNVNVALSSTSSEGLANSLRRKGLGLLLSAALIESATLRPQGYAFLQNSERLTPALNFVNEYLDKPINVEDLAALVHLSPSRFRTVFHAALGMSPSEYIRLRRLYKARDILLSSDQTVSEAATSSGYPDPFHFSRAFRKQFGQSPTGYRQKVVKGHIAQLTARPVV